MPHQRAASLVAIACGGTGGHLFPGMAVGGELIARGCDVTLLISTRDIDRQAARSAEGMTVETLPAVGLVRGNIVGFLKGFRASIRRSCELFARRTPRAVLAMGGFTSAPPILAARCWRAARFLHESNTVPGRANRLLARFVDQAFVGFPSCAGRLRTSRTLVTGTPVRPQFRRADAGAARLALGLDPARETILVMGGSQGAASINHLMMRCVSEIVRQVPAVQFLHLTGSKDCEQVIAAYSSSAAKAVVRPFLSEMELALNAATIAVSRCGASSLAEFAAVGVPSILIPYPAAADNHQFHNARALVESGAARMLGETQATPEILATLTVGLVTNPAERQRLTSAIAKWHFPDAAQTIADAIVKRIADRQAGAVPSATRTARGEPDAPLLMTSLRSEIWRSRQT